MVVLCRQYLGGGQYGSLFAVINCTKTGQGGHQCFAAAHVALQQALHGVRLGQVVENFLAGTFLCAGQFEGQLGDELFHQT